MIIFIIFLKISIQTTSFNFPQTKEIVQTIDREKMQQEELLLEEAQDNRGMEQIKQKRLGSQHWQISESDGER